MTADFIIWTCMTYYHGLITRAVGAYQIASWLQKHGYRVKVIDFCHLLTTEELVKITEKYIGKNTIGIGVSTSFWKNYNETLEKRKTSNDYHEPNWVINARIKIESKYKNLQWIMGGSNTGFFKLNKHKWTIMPGYCEENILKFLNEKSGKTSFTNFDIKLLNASFLYDDTVQPHEVLPIELGRGCQFKCNFCRFELLGKKKNTYIRCKNKVDYELRENYEKFGVTRYVIVDDTTNESIDKIRNLAEIAQKLPFKLEWTGYNRLDMIGSRPETINILRDSGLKSAYFGIESFHKNGSKVAGKPWLGVKGKDFLLKLKIDWGTDINFFISLIVGLADETVDDLYNTSQWCIDNEIASWQWHPLHITKSKNMITPSLFDKEYESYGYWFPDDLQEHNWKSDNWDFNTAIKISEKLNAIEHNYGKPTAFMLSALATTTKNSFDSLMSKKRIDLNWEMIQKNKQEFISNYIKFHHD